MQNIHVTGGADFIGSHVAKWLILVTPTKEFPFVDAVHKGAKERK